MSETMIFELVKAAIQLAIIRHGLGDFDGNMNDEHAEEIAIDTWNALRGIDTCIGEPIAEWAAVKAFLVPNKERA